MNVYVYVYVYIHSSQDTWQHPGNVRCQDTRKKRTRVLYYVVNYGYKHKNPSGKTLTDN